MGHVTGYGLFRVKEFDEITHNFSAHVNAFIKPVAYLHFESVTESVENVQCISDGVLTPTLRHFLRLNVPRSGVLGVNEENIAKAILACDFGFECVWHASVREVLRVIRTNFTRLTRSLVTQPGNAFSLAVGGAVTSTADKVKPSATEARARLVVGIARASLQLNMNQCQVTDSVIIKALRLMDELDVSLTKSASRLRQLYGVHFPEVCWPGNRKRLCLKDLQLIKLIAAYPSRRAISAVENSDFLKLFEEKEMADQVKTLALESIGTELISDDEENVSRFATHLLKLIEMREHHIQLLASKIKVLVPNLNGLLDNILSASRQLSSEYSFRVGDNLTTPLVVARLIANAGSLMRLATMPTSRILSIGASKAVFRKSGAVAASSTGLLGNSVASTTITYPATMDKANTVRLPTVRSLSEVSGTRVTASVARRKAARLLAAKASLASRADFFRSHNPVERKEQSLVERQKEQSVGTVDSRLESGAFGQRLAHEMQHQLRSWAEANGIHVERTSEELKEQRERRKKYRKTKRKAWLARKLTRAAATTPVNAVTHVSSFGATRKEPMDVDEEVQKQSLFRDDSTSEDSESDGSLLKRKLLEFNTNRNNLTEKTDDIPGDSYKPRRSLRIRHVTPQCT